MAARTTTTAAARKRAVANRRKSLLNAPKSPADPELRAHAHALLDVLFEQYPLADMVMIALCDGPDCNAASIPRSFATKRAIIDILHETIHGDD